MTDKMKTISIKGKSYVQVNERVKAFRSSPEFKGWSIDTIIHELTDDVCVMCARILNAEGNFVATGWAREVRNDATSMVNKTSYVENCETSAVGRALGFLGIGIDENICSAEELVYAIQAQNNAPAAPKKQERVIPTLDPLPPVSEEEKDAFTGFLADIEAAENMQQLTATMTRAKGNPYYAAIAHAANNKAYKNGWRKNG